MADNEPIVSIYLRGDRLDPAELTALLGVEPSFSNKKGDELKSPVSSAKGQARTGLWRLSAHSNSSFLSEHIAELRNSLPSQAQNLLSLPHVEEAYLDIFLPIDFDGADEKSVALALSSSDITFIQSLGLSIQFTMSLGHEKREI